MRKKEPKLFIRVGDYIYRRATVPSATVALVCKTYGSWIATLTQIDGKPYEGEYDDWITSSANGRRGHEALRNLATHWDRAGFLD